MAPEWLLVPLPSKARPPAGARERTQPRKAPSCSYRSNTGPRMSAGQSARFGTMLRAHSRGWVFRRPTTTKSKAFYFAKGVYGRKPAPKTTRHKGASLQSRPKPCPRNSPGNCSAPFTRTWPLHRAKRYFSPRDARLSPHSRPKVANPNHYSSGAANERPKVANPNHYSSGAANDRPKVVHPSHYSSGAANDRPKVANPNHDSSGAANERPKVVHPNHCTSGEANSRPTVAHPEIDPPPYLVQAVDPELTCRRCRAYGPVHVHPFMRPRDVSDCYVEAEILPAESRHVPAGGTKEPARLQCWMMHAERTAIYQPIAYQLQSN
jgi:hypothetical protein